MGPERLRPGLDVCIYKYKARVTYSKLLPTLREQKGSKCTKMQGPSQAFWEEEGKRFQKVCIIFLLEPNFMLESRSGWVQKGILGPLSSNLAAFWHPLGSFVIYLRVASRRRTANNIPKPQARTNAISIENLQAAGVFTKPPTFCENAGRL